MSRESIFHEIDAERKRQDVQWGVQAHPMVPADAPVLFFKKAAEYARNNCDKRATLGTASWYDILREEFYEAFAEDFPVRQREELVQVAAVALEIIESIDRAAGRKKS